MGLVGPLFGAGRVLRVAADGPSDGVLVAGAADDGVPVELGGVFEHHDLALELRGVGVEQVAGDPIHRVGLVQCRGGVAQSHLPAVRTLVGVGERGLDGCGHLVGVAGAGGHGVLVQGVAGRHRGGVRREQVGVDGVLRDVGPAVRRFDGDDAVVGEGVDACPRRLRGVGCGQRAEGEQRCDGGQSAQTQSAQTFLQSFVQTFVHIG